jgi:hypothetical protein
MSGGRLGKEHIAYMFTNKFYHINGLVSNPSIKL